MVVMMARKWNSLSEFVDYAAGDSEVPNEARSSRREGSADFAGTATYAEAEALAFNWPEGVAQVERIRARIGLASQKVRKTVRMREAGPGVVSMGHYMSGHPQPFAVLEDDARKVKGKGKIVRILVNCSVSAGVTQEVIMRRGAAMLALVAALEQAGRRVELTVANFADYQSGRGVRQYDYRVTLKRAEAKLNLNSVVFAMAHPSFLRRFVFAAKEREPGFRRMGAPMDPTNVPSEVVYLGGASSYDDAWKSDENAAKWIESVLVDQGVKVRR